MPRRWLFKTEPNEYSYRDLEQEKKAVWDGVGNNLALKNLREVRLGDELLIYHSADEKAIVGIAEAISDPYPDPKDTDEKVVVVNLKPVPTGTAVRGSALFESTENVVGTAAKPVSRCSWKWASISSCSVGWFCFTASR